jgi:hypothetical protein
MNMMQLQVREEKNIQLRIWFRLRLLFKYQFKFLLLIYSTTRKIARLRLWLHKTAFFFLTFFALPFFSLIHFFLSQKTRVTDWSRSCLMVPESYHDGDPVPRKRLFCMYMTHFCRSRFGFGHTEFC